MTKSVYLVLILFVLGFLCPPRANAQSTEITYQGSLKVSGLPANANYDFEFRLYDAVSGGTQVGPLVVQSTVVVADGVFSVKLNFGPNFPGTDRYLDISVRPAGSGGFTPLNPRQKIGSVPYAIQSLNAGNSTFAVTAQNSASLGGVAAAQYVVTTDPRMSDPRAPVAGSPNYIQNTNSLQATSNFNISGTGRADTFNATTSYNFAGAPLLSALGVNNVFLGASSGLLNTGTFNAFVGGFAGFENKGGSNNAFFGAEAGKNNSFGSNNSFFGAFSGNSTTTGNDNSFFGHRSGLANTAGTFNSFFGTFAGTFNSTGSDNSFFGNSSGFTSNGNRNSFFGSQAGNLTNTGSDNSFVGSYAGQGNTTGSNNVFIGSRSGNVNAGGTNNSFFGTNSGFSNTSNGNSFFGMESGYSNMSGSSNSFFGRASGRQNTTGQLNVFIGMNAGIANTIGSFNTIIGSEANVVGTNLTYATAIGAEAVVDSSNTIVMGRAADTVRVPGAVSVLGTFSAANLSLSTSNVTGILGVSNGGTGLAFSGTPGHFLRSNGSGWTSLPFTVADIPAGSTNYIHNTSIQQGTSNFNISGNGTAGGTLSGNAVNSVTQYNIAGSHILSSPGLSNLFAGGAAGGSNTTGSSNSFFGASAGTSNSSAGSNSFFGANAGAGTNTGANNTYVGAGSGQAGTTGANNAYFGFNAGAMNTIGSNNTLVGSNSNVGSNNLTYATAIGADAVVSTNNSLVLGRTVDTVRVPGNINVQGTLTATTFSIPAGSITGVLQTNQGGTGFGSPGGAGNYLRSNGTAWTTSPIPVGDVPSGSGHYIQNGVGQQATSNFNISGTGTVGGLFSAGTVNAVTQYSFGGTRILTANGTNNIFAGPGTATTGNNNSFFGANTALANTTGTSNTIIGGGANVGSGNLIFATALGSGAVVNDNNSVVLGRSSDTVRIPGNLNLTGTFTGALPAANISGVLAPLNGGTGMSGSTGTNFLRGDGGGGWVNVALVAADLPSGSINYIQNGTGVQASSNFNISNNGVIGQNLTVGGGLALGGPLTGTYTVPVNNILGVLGTSKGGTGFNASTGRNFLRGDNGGGWEMSGLTLADIPNLGGSYIQNGTGLQASSNFNVSGTGTVGGLFSANTVNATSQYNIAGARVFTTTGTNNVFVGADTATTGSSNTFVGDGTGAANTTGTSNTLLGANTNVGGPALTFATAVGAGAVVSNNNSVVLGRGADTVRVPGDLNVTGTFTATSFNVPVANIQGVLGTSKGGTGFGSSTGRNFLRGDNGGGWEMSGLTASDIVAGSSNYIQNGAGPQTANFNITGNGTITGSLSVSGSLTGGFSIPAGNIGGILARGNGGTGLNVTGPIGNFLRSDGTNWVSSGLIANDIPNLSASYIQNSIGTQTPGNFNISGAGTVGGLFSANTVNATSQYNIAGARVFTTTGANNVFVGADTATTGSSNTFVGDGTGAANTTGTSNTLLGANTNLGGPALSFATAVGAGAVVNNNNSVVLGRGADTVRVPGDLNVTGTFTATSFNVPVANIQGVLETSKGGTGFGSSTGRNFLRGNNVGGWEMSGLTAGDLPSGSTNYIHNSGSGQAGATFNIGGSGTIGSNLTVVGGLSLGGGLTGSYTVPVTNITGILGTAKGGTGFDTTTGTNFLRGNGSGGWTMSGLTSGDIVSGSTNYIQNGTGVQASSNFNISNNGVIGQNLNVGGSLTLGGALTGSFTIPVGNITGILGTAKGGTGFDTTTGTNFLRGNGTGGWEMSGLTSGDIIGGSTNYIQNGTGVQTTSNFNISNNGVIGQNLSVGGSLTLGGALTGTYTVPVNNIMGVLGTAKGGTGFGASTGRNFLRGDNGGGWEMSGLTLADIPNLGGTYIQNGTGQQATSDFNVSGTGTVGGLFSANTVNSTLQYNIGGNRVFTTSGTSNVFAGANTGTAGSSNSFFGNSAGSSSTGSSNTLIGANADTTAGVSNGTAVGANAVVGQSNAVVLGATNASVGIGTSTPKTKLDVTGGHISVGTPGQGIILKSPNGGTCSLLTIADVTGALVVTQGVPCP